MAIHILTGLPGSGKTAFLSKKANDFAKQGREVWANKGYTLNIPNVRYYSKIKELVNIKNGVILMDEAQVYLNSRNWETLDEQFVYKLQQHRHHGLDIWGTVQNVKRLDVVMRELVSHYYECRILNFLILKFILVRQYDIRDAEKPDEKRKMLDWHLNFFDEQVFDLYDTFGDVERFEEVVSNVVTRDFRKCPDCGHLKMIR